MRTNHRFLLHDSHFASHIPEKDRPYPKESFEVDIKTEDYPCWPEPRLTGM